MPSSFTFAVPHATANCRDFSKSVPDEILCKNPERNTSPQPTELFSIVPGGFDQKTPVFEKPTAPFSPNVTRTYCIPELIRFFPVLKNCEKSLSLVFVSRSSS